MSTRLSELDEGLARVGDLSAGHGFVNTKAVVQQAGDALQLSLRAEAGWKPSETLDLYGEAWADLDPSLRVNDYGAGVGARWRF